MGTRDEPQPWEPSEYDVEKAAVCAELGIEPPLYWLPRITLTDAEERIWRDVLAEWNEHQQMYEGYAHDAEAWLEEHPTGKNENPGPFDSVTPGWVGWAGYRARTMTDFEENERKFVIVHCWEVRDEEYGRHKDLVSQLAMNESCHSVGRALTAEHRARVGDEAFFLVEGVLKQRRKRESRFPQQWSDEERDAWVQACLKVAREGGKDYPESYRYPPPSPAVGVARQVQDSLF